MHVHSKDINSDFKLWFEILVRHLPDLPDQFRSPCMCIRTYTCIHIYVHTFAYMYPYIHMNTYIRRHVFIHKSVHTNAYIYTYTHMYTCIRTYTCIHIYVYMYAWCVIESHDSCCTVSKVDDRVQALIVLHIIQTISLYTHWWPIINSITMKHIRESPSKVITSLKIIRSCDEHLINYFIAKPYWQYQSE